VAEVQSIRKKKMAKTKPVRSSIHSSKRAKARIALVTGGSSGIGAAICLRLASEGTFVYVNYRANVPEANRLVRKIKANGGHAVAVQANVTSEAQVEAMFRQVKEEHGRLDIMVNNAGVERPGPFLKMKLSDWDLVLNTNLRGTFICGQAAARIMAKKKQGVIINISSVHEKIPWGGYAHYCASKGGLGMLTKTMALELAAHGIRVNNIAPGAISTPINNSWIHNKALKKIVLEKIPDNRLGTPEEVAGAAAYLVSDEARYITGTTLYIDGGMTLYSSFLKQG
jgi:glucose 1-dehydrogenase